MMSGTLNLGILVPIYQNHIIFAHDLGVGKL